MHCLRKKFSCCCWEKTQAKHCPAAFVLAGPESQLHLLSRGCKLTTGTRTWLSLFCGCCSIWTWPTFPIPFIFRVICSSGARNTFVPTNLLVAVHTHWNINTLRRYLHILRLCMLKCVNYFYLYWLHSESMKETVIWDELCILPIILYMQKSLWWKILCRVQVSWYL